MNEVPGFSGNARGLGISRPVERLAGDPVPVDPGSHLRGWTRLNYVTDY
jgi:hypothetical protein